MILVPPTNISVLTAGGGNRIEFPETNDPRVHGVSSAQAKRAYDGPFNRPISAPPAPEGEQQAGAGLPSSVRGIALRGFSRPRTMGWLSFWIPKLAKRGSSILRSPQMEVCRGFIGRFAGCKTCNATGGSLNLTWISGSKNRYRNGTLVSGNMDQSLSNPSWFILSHTHVWLLLETGSACF